MIDSITKYFEVTQYNNTKAMTIANLVKTMWLVSYPRPVEIMYDQGGEFLGNEFGNILIEQYYVIKTKPDSSGNQQANAIIDRIHEVLGKLIPSFNPHDTYVYDSEPWMGILAAANFAVQDT